MSDTTNVERFSNRSQDYGQYRPGYSREIVYYLRDVIKLQSRDTIADIGSGTGLFSELFLKDGYNVIAVEPNQNMRAVAEMHLHSYPLFRSVAAAAEHTTLPDKSIDLITAAQAFHWFNMQETREEFFRIARPRAHCFLVWNILLTDTVFSDAYQKLKNKYAIRIKNVRRADVNGIRDFFSPAEIATRNFHYTQTLNTNELSGLLSSSSMVPAPGSPGHDIMLAELQALFAKHNEQGVVTMEYETQTFLVQLRR